MSILISSNLGISNKNLELLYGNNTTSYWSRHHSVHILYRPSQDLLGVGLLECTISSFDWIVPLEKSVYNLSVHSVNKRTSYLRNQILFSKFFLRSSVLFCSKYFLSFFLFSTMHLNFVFFSSQNFGEKNRLMRCKHMGLKMSEEKASRYRCLEQVVTDKYKQRKRYGIVARHSWSTIKLIIDIHFTE